MRAQRRIELVIAGLFAVTALSGVALLAVYILGGQTQVEGILLGIALGSLGLGVVLWAQELMDTPIVIEERQSATSSPAEAADFQAALTEEAGFTRRRMLVGMLLAAFAGLGAALAIPVLSLGPAPGREQFTTSWRKGSRLVLGDGTPVRAGDLPVDSLVTVFPEDAIGVTDSQTLLIRVPPDLLRLDPARAAWAPGGYVAYSKICTHAGCPVGLFRATERKLICPCHQSTFDVLAGAAPVFGPAGRPLPQLPIHMEADGTFVADGDFPDPVGPSFWNLTSRGGAG
ncbi:MAG: Rieske 2Fe-2S domain-containing protein [Chloroflexi bacterium]|nr:MAG: Rieske 2Fe-2S domain-containing protein [Chloroflexota bacterium]